jgi:transposase
MKVTLTPEEKNDLEARHAQEPDGRIRDRIKSVLLSSEGWKVPKIAQALRIHKDTVIRYLLNYIDARRLKAKHQGSEGKLNDAQTQELKTHISENLYSTAVEIMAHVKQAYGVSYSLGGMTSWLKRHGFSYKETKGQPAKANIERQETFVEAYEKLKTELPKDELLLFIDAVHPTMASKISRGWILTGQDKILPTVSSRTRMNIVGSIELATMKVMTADYETINSASIIDFLKGLEAANPLAKTLHIVLDQSGYHRSQELADYEASSRIKLHFLPPYSPNLNPIERLWKVMNEHVRNNVHFKSAKEFREKIRGFFKEKLPDIGESLRSRINDNFHIPTAAK